MNQTHFHLLITHLPIVGSLLGAIVLSYGIWRKSFDTLRSAYILFIISSIGAASAYLTGEASEETVENIEGISKDLIEQHENIASIALAGFGILGIVSIIAFVLSVKKQSLARGAAIVTLIISIICFAIVGWTGYLGGQIRHTEIQVQRLNFDLYQNRTFTLSPQFFKSSHAVVRNPSYNVGLSVIETNESIKTLNDEVLPANFASQDRSN